MVQERASQARRLRVLKGRPEAEPVLDLGEALRLYNALVNETRQLEAMVAEMRGRILRAMERSDVTEFQSGGIEAIRQIRHLSPRLDQERATEILEREGKLREAQRSVLDPVKARHILDDMVRQGRLERAELPYGEPREVEALIVRDVARERPRRSRAASR